MDCEIEGCTREATEQFSAPNLIHSFCTIHFWIARALKVVAYGIVILLAASPVLLGWFIL